MTAAIRKSIPQHGAVMPAQPRAAGWVSLPLALTLVALTALAGCQTTTGLPTVDDTQRRPINSAAAIELQSCKAEASALRATLSETVAPQCPRTEPSPRPAVLVAAAAAGTAAGTVAGAGPAVGAGAVSRLAVFTFEQGQVSLTVDEATRVALKTAADSAQLIQIRGRSGAQQETPADVQAARRRAEAAVGLLKELGVPAQKLRVSWQGMADEGAAAGQGRRVEIEFLDKAPTVLFTKAAADKGAATAGSGSQANAAPADTAARAPSPSPSPKS